jgi:hypothetical protein
MNHKRDHGKQEQQMDQGARDMKYEECANPRNQQDHKQHHEYKSHESPFLSRDCRISGGLAQRILLEHAPAGVAYSDSMS